MVWGCSCFHRSQVVVTTVIGLSFSPLPTSGPITGSPLIVDHIDSVAWSYISLLER